MKRIILAAQVTGWKYASMQVPDGLPEEDIEEYIRDAFSVLEWMPELSYAVKWNAEGQTEQHSIDI